MENKLKPKVRIANKNAVNKKLNYCKVCNKIFDHERIYLMHNREVHKTNKHPCQECRSSFRRADHLARHVKSKHTAIERFPCALCGSEFTRRDHLVRHLKTRHKCLVFKCSSDTDRTQEDISGENSNPIELQFDEGFNKEECKYCKATYKRSDHLLRHVKSKHLNVTVKCPLCASEYKRRDRLTRHLKLKHDVT